MLFQVPISDLVQIATEVQSVDEDVALLDPDPISDFKQNCNEGRPGRHTPLETNEFVNSSPKTLDYFNRKYI